MAGRSEARIFTSIWKDKAFLALPPSAQRMYLFLLSQPDLSFCGVLSLRARRWARSADGLTVDQVEADLATLSRPVPMPSEPLTEGIGEGFPEGFARPFLVIDEDAEEVLIRSFIRRDQVWKQPNLMKSARDAAGLVESTAIQAALLDELRRIPAHESSSEHVRTVHAEFVADLEKAIGNPSDDPSRKGSANPSGNPSADPSQERGGSNGSSTGNLLTPVTPGPGAPEPPRASARPTPPGNQLLAEHLAACASKPPRSVQARTGQKIDELLDEGIPAGDIRAGLTLMRARPRTGPGLLPELVHEAATLRASPQVGSYQPYQNPDDQSVYDEDLSA